jgi:predicted permease
MPRFDPPSAWRRVERGWDLARAYCRAALMSRRRDDDQLRADLEFHLEQVALEQRRAGMPEAAARQSALRTFGNPVRVIEEVRDMSPWSSIERLAQDVRYGVRGFFRAPAFTATIIFSLGLAIGASTAIFSVVDAFVFRWLPVHQPERLFTLRAQGTPMPGGGIGRAFQVSYPDFLTVRDRLPQFAQVAAGGGRLDRYNITASGPDGGLDPQQAWIEMVSGNYFSTLGVGASRGRVLTPDDDRAAGASPVAVISHAYWRRRFASASDVVGRTLAWNDATFVIVGVGAEGFTGLTTGFATDIWLPQTMQPLAIPEAPNFLTNGNARWIQLVARLKPDVTVEQGSAAANLVWQQLERERGGAASAAPSQTSNPTRLELASLAAGFDGPRVRFAQPLVIVFVVMMLVLTVACVTVANLVLARAVGRTREFAVRRALGASRGRIMRQLATESALLAGAAGVLGLFVGLWLGESVPRLLDVDLLSGAARLDVGLNLRVLGFVAALCVLATLSVGLAPILKGSKASLTFGLSGTRTTGDRAGVGIRRGLIVAQVAVSFVLLTGGALFTRTVQNLASIDIGIDSDHTLIVWTRPGQTALVDDDRKAMYERAADALSRLPNVRTVGFSYGALFPPNPGTSAVVPVDGRQQNVSATAVWRYAAPKMLEAVGIPLVAGRDFSERDQAKTPHVAIVNRVLARQFFADENPIGHHFRFTNGGGPIEIVGVMADTAFESPRDAPRPSFYLAHRQVGGNPGGIVWLAVRTTDRSVDLSAPIRQTLRGISPDLAVLSIEYMSDVLDRARGQERLLALTSTSLAAVATVLTYVGLYGLIAFMTARRTHEIGLRLALGATRGNVVWSILRESVMLVAAGGCLGIPAALAATSLLSNRFYGVASRDPLTIAGAAILMLIVAVLASLLPARRAAMTTPTIALRCE